MRKVRLKTQVLWRHLTADVQSVAKAHNGGGKRRHSKESFQVCIFMSLMRKFNSDRNAFYVSPAPSSGTVSSIFSPSFSSLRS